MFRNWEITTDYVNIFNLSDKNNTEEAGETENSQSSDGNIFMQKFWFISKAASPHNPVKDFDGLAV